MELLRWLIGIGFILGLPGLLKMLQQSFLTGNYQDCKHCGAVIKSKTHRSICPVCARYL